MYKFQAFQKLEIILLISSLEIRPGIYVALQINFPSIFKSKSALESSSSEEEFRSRDAMALFLRELGSVITFSGFCG